MDIDRLLNIEKRTGIKNDDIDSFVDKVIIRFVIKIFGLGDASSTCN